MAPPSSRRPGFSRRAQYSLFAGYVVAVFGALLALLLIITARFDPAGNAAMQNFFGDVFAPVSSAGRAIVRGARAGSEGVSAYFFAASKNRAMAEELKRTRVKLIQGQRDANEVKRLKAMLGVVERLPNSVVTAYLVSSTGASSRRYAMLAAGRSNGILPGQPVRSPDGLVGRIVQAGQSSARVLLIVDSGNIVPVKRASDGIPAFAYGLGDGRLDVRPLSVGSNPFKAGDIFITSGTGGVYQPGIPVAVGVKSSRDGTIGRPLADPARLDFAIVEREFIEPMPPPAETQPAPDSQ